MVRTAARFGALLLAFAGAWSAHAATLSVTAVIRPKAMLQFQDVPSALHISEQDVRNGFVDARAPVGLAVRSSGQRGLMLVVTLLNEHVRRVRMDGLGQPLQIQAGGGSTWLPPTVDKPLALQFRFYLAPGTPAGVYPWPVQLAASA
jgi:hypothetical protein